MKPTKYLSSVLLLLLAINTLLTAQGLRPAECTTPLPYFDDFENGFVILRDGTRIEGEISIKNYEKDGRISVTPVNGDKLKIDVLSLSSWGLNINIPRNYSPLNYYDWKNQKRKETKEPERGFVMLTNGETKQGRIMIEGRSSDSPLAAENYFAIESLTYVDKSGNAVEYDRENIKGFGRVLPWPLTPSELFNWQNGEFMGKRKTQKQMGYAIMNDGSKIEGEMQLVVKNKLPRTKGSSSDPMERSENLDKTRSDIVDEIYFTRDGKDEKIDLDDVFAYGLQDVTINMLTNNGDRAYIIEKMNFHPGTVTTKDGKKKDGFLAYFPYPDNYYGVYFASSRDEPVITIPMKDIKDVDQRISLIEAFGDEEPKKPNNNINGYILGLNGLKYEGTISLVDDNEWWARAISFIDKQGNTITYGGESEPIAYFVKDGVMYVQDGSIFVMAEQVASPLALYTNPFPDNSTALGRFAMTQVTNIAAGVVATAAAGTVWGAQSKYGVNTSGIEVNGQESGALDFGANVGSAAADGLTEMMTKGSNKEELPSKAKRGEQLKFININTGEIGTTSEYRWEMLLDGCKGYLDLDSKSKKAILKSGDREILDYLNKCYSR
ncbi:MAG: hypothetical protein RLN86_11455 [Cyclobacteriaceae bacterium]